MERQMPTLRKVRQCYYIVGDTVWKIHVAPLYRRGSAQMIIIEVGLTHLAQSTGYLLLLCDVSCIERGVVVFLYNVENRHRVTTRY